MTWSNFFATHNHCTKDVPLIISAVTLSIVMYPLDHKFLLVIVHFKLKCHIKYILYIYDFFIAYFVKSNKKITDDGRDD